MPARTTTKDGVLSDATVLNGGTPWVTGDTLTYSHNVTIDVPLDMGSSPSTGGTAAIAASSAVTGKTLTIAAAVICRGPVSVNASYNGKNTIAIQGGGDLIMTPPSGQQYEIDCIWNSNVITTATSSGSHASLRTDKSSGGLSSYIKSSNDRTNGLTNADYLDLYDFGDTTNWGVVTWMRDTSGYAVSVTNCTFTRCNYQLATGFGNGYDQNVTFSNNRFISSVSMSLSGGSFPNICCLLGFGVVGTTGTRTFDSNGFDKGVYFQSFKLRSGGGQFANNVIGDKSFMDTNCAWAADTQFSNNLLYGGNDTINFAGPVKDSYLANTTATNPHFCGYATSVSAMTFTGVLFEVANASNDGQGDLIIKPGIGSGTPTLGIFNCIAVASTNGKTAGVLLQTSSAVGLVACTLEHCTAVLFGGESGLIRLDETASSYAGLIANCRSNLCVSDSADTYIYIIQDAGAGTPAVDAVTKSDYNAIQNPSSGTCTYNTSTSQAGVVGYAGIKVSNASAFPNSQVGQHDITLSANPLFDKTRNLATWAQVNHGTDGSYAAAFAVLLANPSLIGQASTGLIAWVRAGHQVTGAAGLLLKDAGHDGVTIGAGEYVAPASTGSIGIGDLFGNIFGNVFGDLEPPITGY